MVKLATTIQSQGRTKAVPPVIVELAGPAGAGKTTLSRALAQRDAKVLIGADIELRKIRHIPIFIRSVPSSISLFLSQPRPNRRFTWAELKYIAYLKGWPHLLKRQASNKGRVVLLDHGPVFRLATLREFGPEILKSATFDAWWHNLYRQWASTLDLIVWLDASDEVLMGRINTRNKDHDVKGKADLEAQQFLRRYRKSYIGVLTKLVSCNGPAVLQFDTNKASIEQIADHILAACKSRAHRS